MGKKGSECVKKFNVPDNSLLKTASTFYLFYNFNDKVKQLENCVGDSYKHYIQKCLLYLMSFF